MSEPVEPAQAAPISESSNQAPGAPESTLAQAAGNGTSSAPAVQEGAEPPNDGTPSNSTGEAAGDLSQSNSLRDLCGALRNPELLASTTAGAQNENQPTGDGRSQVQPGNEDGTGTQGAEPASPAPENSTPETEEKERPERIRIGSFAESDQDFLLSVTQVARSEGITVREATARVMAQQQAQAAAETGEHSQAQEGQEDRLAEADVINPLEAQRAKVDDLKEQLREAASAFDTDRQAELQIELAEAVAERKIMESEQARAAKTQETSAATEWKATETSAFTAMESDYPDFQKPGTPLNAAVTQKIAALEKSNPAFFNQPDWIRYVVRDAAEEVGVLSTRRAAAATPIKTPAASTPPPPAKAAPRQPGHPAAMPPAPGNTGAGNQGADDGAALVNSNDPKALMAFLRRNGTRAQ